MFIKLLLFAIFFNTQSYANENEEPFFLPISRPEILPNSENFHIINELVKNDQKFDTKLIVKQSDSTREWSFIFDGLIASAVFKSGNFLWLVFDEVIDVDTKKITDSDPNIISCEKINNKDYSVYKILYKANFPFVKVDRKYFNWVITTSDNKGNSFFSPEKIIKELPQENIYRRNFIIERPGKKLNLLDKERSIILQVIPSIVNNYALNYSYSNPEYEILGAAQGFAVALISDNISLIMQKKQAILHINHENNENPISVVSPDFIGKYDLAPSILGEKNDANITENNSNILFQKMKNYTDQTLYKEALSIAELIENIDKELSKTNKFLLYKIFLHLMNQEYKEIIPIFEKLDLNKLSSQRLLEANFWLDMAKFKLSMKINDINYPEIYEKLLKYYPDNIQFYFAEILINYAFYQENYPLIQQIIDHYLDKKLPFTFKNLLDFSTALLEEKKGNLEKSVEIYKRLSQIIEDNFVRAKSIFNLVKIENKLDQITYQAAIDQLNLARFLWRGDDLELSIANYIADLHYNNHNYPDALRSWKSILNSFPKNNNYLTILGRMSQVFAETFEDEDEKQNIDLTSFKKIALYYEFKELTPLGARGDELVTKLVKLAIKLNLIDEAIKILDYQTKYRFVGKKQIQSITQLAALYLEENQPDKALEFLKNNELKNIDFVDFHELQKRAQIKSRAFIQKKDYNLALTLIEDDLSISADKLRTEIFWKLNDWPNLEKYLLYVLANITGKETHSQISDYLLKLAISYNKQNKSDNILNIIDTYPNIIAYNQALYKKLVLLINKENTDNNKNNLDSSKIEDLLKEIKNKK